jgi:hypothetical protein
MEDELNLTEPSPNLAEVCGEIIAITPPRTFFVSAAARFLAPPSSLTLVRRLEVFAVFVFFLGMMFSFFLPAAHPSQLLILGSGRVLDGDKGLCGLTTASLRCDDGGMVTRFEREALLCGIMRPGKQSRPDIRGRDRKAYALYPLRGTEAEMTLIRCPPLTRRASSLVRFLTVSFLSFNTLIFPFFFPEFFFLAAMTGLLSVCALELWP